MNAYVLGVGKTRFGPSSHPMTRLAHEAILGALADADMEITDIGAVLVANFLGGPNESQLHLGSVVMGLFPGLHVPSWRVEAACASGGVAIHQAVTMLGTYDPILVVGVERLSGRPGIEQTRNIGMAGDVLLDSAQGLNFPASYALVAQRHMQRYGTRTRDFELISLKNHENARHNPLAHFHHKVVTQADIDAGATVASPLRLFDCCPVSDGAAAAIISREARDARSVPILGSAVAADVISLAQRDEHTSFAAARFAAGEAYRQAGITPADIDLAEVHDCFTIAEIVAMEDLGLAPAGEAVDLIRADETRPGGTMPVNPSGGLKAGGHAIGATGTRTPRSRSSGPWSRCSMSRASLRATRRRCRWTSCRPRSRGRSGSAVCTSSTRRRGCGSWRSSGPPRPRTRPPSSSSTSRSHSARRPSGWLTAPASWSTAC